jgi:superfamily II DNA or RNA helicase
LDLKPAYDSDEDDVLNDFYIPVLSEAVRYRRLAGFFSSTALAVAARGIYNFILRGGEMELIAGARLSKEDVEAINAGTLEPERVISETVIKDLENIEEEFVKDHVRALAWMVAKKKLNIKIAIPLDEEGRPLDEEAIETRGIFHQKVGIFLDTNNDIISFSGSMNETAHSWLHNIEEFKVFRSWVKGEELHLESDVRKMRKYWEGRAKNTIVTDVPTAVRERLIRMAPENIEELRLQRYAKRRIELRDYQMAAVESWFAEGKGFIEMATGTGKTYTAIACLDKLKQRERRLEVIISVPFVHLVTQWMQDLRDWGLKGLSAHGSADAWTNSLMNEVLDLNNGYVNLLIVITTHDTFSNPKFSNIVVKANAPILLIADEVHGLGSQQRKGGLIDRYEYRLGLSATPRRWLDDEGTGALENYFGRTVFEFSLNHAIAAGHLVPYEYYPHFVEMTDAELSEYKEYSRKLAKQYFAAKDDTSRARVFDLLAILRQRIVVNAKNKISEFVKLLDSLGELEYCLIYCSPNQIEEVQRLLNDRGIIHHKFTARENKEERELLLNRFADGTYKALVAMMCLDEGVNVPPTRMAIFLASSGNPKQFIQRRGRILRPFKDKKKAVIHDIIVVPTISGKIEPELFDMERKILNRELSRLHEFASASTNPADTVNAIHPILKLYRLSLKGVME